MLAASAVHHHGSYLCGIPNILPERSTGLAEDEDRVVPSYGSGLDVSHHMPLVSMGFLIRHPAPPYAVQFERPYQGPSSHPM